MSEDRIAGARSAAASDANALAPIVLWAYLGGIVKEYDALAARLAEVERERDGWRQHAEDEQDEAGRQARRADEAELRFVGAEARLAAVRSLIDEAEAGAGIIITPGFTTYYAVDTGLLREALAVPAGTAQPDEEQP